MSDDLDTLFPGLVVKVDTEEIKIVPFYFGQLARVATLVRPIAQAAIESGILTITPDPTNETSNIKIDKNFVPMLFQLADEGSESVMLLIAFACNKPRAWLNTVDIDVGMQLAEAVFSVNKDFFVKRVIPKLASKLSKFATIGAILSPDSSGQGTGDQT